MPPTRVDPLLLIPGNNAITWNNPTTKASIIVIFSFSFFPFKSFTRKSINAVISNEIPTNLTEVKLSILLLNNKPTIPAKTSDLENDSDFTTKKDVDDIVGNINTLLSEV